MAEKIAAANDGRYQQQACRTLPIPASVTPVAGYPAKLKIYLTNASRYWQVRCFFRGRVHTQSLRTTNKREAIANAKSFYERMVGTFYAQQTAWQPDAAPEQQFETLAERVILLERDRVARGELAEMTYRNTAYRLRQYWLPLLRNKRIEAITHYDIVQAIGVLSRRGISSISLIQYLQSLRLIFKFAYAEKIITQIPTFPKIRKASTPRGGFTVDEYRLLVTTARQLACVSELRKPATHRNRAGGIFTKTESVPRELSWLIGFMVNSFVRPGDLRQLKHKHVTIIRGQSVYLRMNLPETKKHDKPMITMSSSVTQ